MNQQGQENSNGLLVLALGIPIGFMLVWFMFHRQINVLAFHLRFIELNGISYMVNQLNDVANLLYLPHISTWRIDYWRNFVSTHDIANVNFVQFFAISHDVGIYLAGFVVLVFASISLYLIKNSNRSHFSRTHDMKSLRKAECDTWPVIKPSMQVNLVKEDINKGPWAMAETPLTFCENNQLLDENAIENKQLILLKGKAYQAFTLQLGEHWHGLNKLPMHLKALMVCFIAAAEFKKESVVEPLLNQFAKSAAAGQLNFTGVNDLAQKYKKSKFIVFLESHHAYASTILASMLEICRGSGVFANSEFLWLKAIDRRNWYMLNAVGRATPTIEVAGIYSHWLAEKKIGHALDVPMVDQAVASAEEALKDILYTKESDSWHTCAD